MMDQVDHIMAVMEASFDPQWGEAWNRRQVSDALSMPSTFAIVLDQNGDDLDGEDGEPAGFVMTRHAPGEEELLLIAVKPEYRGRGLGRQLINRLSGDARERGAERIFLEMRDNNPAETLYRSVGFEPIGRRPKYYLTKDGYRIDAITFGLNI